MTRPSESVALTRAPNIAAARCTRCSTGWLASGPRTGHLVRFSKQPIDFGHYVGTGNRESARMAQRTLVVAAWTAGHVSPDHAMPVGVVGRPARYVRTIGNYHALRLQRRGDMR